MGDARDFIRSLLGAWDCCATCAGGVLLRHDREVRSRAWQEGFDAGENMAHMWGHVDHWEDWPTNPYATPTDQPEEVRCGGEEVCDE